MSSIDELAIVRAISSSPELAGRLNALRTYYEPGCMIDWYQFEIILGWGMFERGVRQLMEDKARNQLGNYS